MARRRNRKGHKLRIVLGALALLLVAAIAVTVVYAGEIVRRAVERGGSDATQVPVTLEAVQLRGLFAGEAGLRGFRIGNPDGFTTDYIFDLDSVRIAVAPATLWSDPLVIREIVIDGPRAIYEYRNRNTNFGQLYRNIIAGISDRPEDEDTGPGRRVIIEDFQLRNARVAVMAPFLEQQAGLDIPAIRIRNIGKDRGGIRADEALSEIYAQLHRRVAREVGEMGLGELSAHARRARQEAEAVIDEYRDDARRQADDLREEAEDKANDAVRRLRDRF